MDPDARKASPENPQRRLSCIGKAMGSRLNILHLSALRTAPRFPRETNARLRCHTSRDIQHPGTTSTPRQETRALGTLGGRSAPLHHLLPDPPATLVRSGRRRLVARGSGKTGSARPRRRAVDPAAARHRPLQDRQFPVRWRMVLRHLPDGSPWTRPVRPGTSGGPGSVPRRNDPVRGPDAVRRLPEVRSGFLEGGRPRNTRWPRRTRGLPGLPQPGAEPAPFDGPRLQAPHPERPDHRKACAGPRRFPDHDDRDLPLRDLPGGQLRRRGFDPPARPGGPHPTPRRPV